MNLFESKVAGQAIKVRLDEKRRGMSQGWVYAQIPCRPRYQEELPTRRLLLNNVQGVDEHNACNGITEVFTMRLIQYGGGKPGFAKASFCVIIRRFKNERLSLRLTFITHFHYFGGKSLLGFPMKLSRFESMCFAFNHHQFWHMKQSEVHLPFS